MSVKSSNPTRKMHFVPCFYLKNFTRDENILHPLNIREKRIEKSRFYKRFGYENYFYAINTGTLDDLSQDIERWLQSIEDLIAGELPRIISDIVAYRQINDQDRYFLAILMSMLWLRGPGMRNQMKDMNDDFVRQISDLAGTEYAERFRVSDNRNHLRLMVSSIGVHGSGFANMFYHMKWKIYLANGNEEFITSDVPVVERWIPKKDFYGNGFMDRDKYFPLTSRIFLKLTPPCGSSKITRRAIYADQDDIVKELNIITVSGAQKYIYSGDRSLIERMLVGIINPGKLENAYIDKYIKPWRNLRRKERGKAI